MFFCVFYIIKYKKDLSLFEKNISPAVLFTVGSGGGQQFIRHCKKTVEKAMKICYNKTKKKQKNKRRTQTCPNF